MSRFITSLLSIAAISAFASLSHAGEFIDEGLIPADVLEMEAAGEGFDLELDVEGTASALQQYRPAPPRRRPAPPPRRRPAPTQYVCYAENEYRQIYTGRDRTSARFAQAEAMDACRAYSYRCRPLGCDRY